MALESKVSFLVTQNSSCIESAALFPPLYLTCHFLLAAVVTMLFQDQEDQFLFANRF